MKKRNVNMFRDSDKNMLNEIYKTSKDGLESTHRILSKVTDDDLAMDLNRMAYQYSRIQEKTAGELYAHDIEPEKMRWVERMMNWGEQQRETFTDISSVNLARTMIHEKQKRKNKIKKMMSSGKMNETTLEIAKEFVGSEEKAIKRLYSYIE